MGRLDLEVSPEVVADVGPIYFEHVRLDGPGGGKAIGGLQDDVDPPQGYVAFDSEDRWNLFETQTSPDILGAAMHELGHVLGLNHSQYSTANMWPGFFLDQTFAF